MIRGLLVTLMAWFLLVVIILIILIAWFLVVAPVKAATPLDYTRTILEQARSIVAGNVSHSEKLAALSVLFGKFLDTDAMGRQALGQHWSRFKPAQQKEFLALFREVLQRTYVQTLLLFQHPEFLYTRQQFTGEGAIVDTRIVTPHDLFDVTYRLIPMGDNWLVIAIPVEEVNLISNLANEFNHVLARLTVDDLLTLMRRKYGIPWEKHIREDVCRNGE
jgi:phospholipid transport system substrate-binding protein